TPVTLSQVDDKALRIPADSFGKTQLWQALHEARQAALDDIIGSILLDQEAKDRGIERSRLIEEEIGAKVAPPTDAEIAEWYESNPERVQGVPLDRVRAPIKAFLIDKRTKTIRDQYLNQLKSKTSVRITLDPPRQAIATA